MYLKFNPLVISF